MKLNFCIQHDDNGNITGTWGPSESNPPVRENQLILTEWVDITKKRVNIETQSLEDCPIIARAYHNAAILQQLEDLDAKTQRAMRDWVLNDDKSSLIKIEQEAAQLRSQLIKE